MGVWKALKVADFAYFILENFPGIIVHQVEWLLFAKMESMSKNDVEAEASEHGEDGEHSDALAAPLPLVEDSISFEQRRNPGIVFFSTKLPVVVVKRTLKLQGIS